MAILNKIRQRSLFLIVIIALALFSFVFADIVNKSGSNGGGESVATIDGVEISREDFMQKVERAQQSLGGRGSATQALNQVWNTESRRIILENEYEKLGLTVERNQMRDLLRTGLTSFEEFKNEAGLFDEAKLNEFIANLKEISPQPATLGGAQITYADWTRYEGDIANSGLYQNYLNLVQAGINGTIVDAELDHTLENEKVDIKYVQIPYSSIADSLVEVKKSEIEAYIKKNQDQFEVEESRDIYYVQFQETASLADEEAIKADLLKMLDDRVEYNDVSKLTDTIIGMRNTENIKDFINTNSSISFIDRFLIKSEMTPSYSDSLITLEKGEISAPFKAQGFYNIAKAVDIMKVADSVKSSHIIVPYRGAFQAAPNVTRSRDEAQAMVDSILPLVENNKNKFNEVANEINSDGTKGKNGEVGWTRLTGLNPNAFDPDYANYIFYNDKGSVEIVETKFGFHIIRIDDAKNYEKAIKLANLALPIEPSEATINEVFNKTSKFEIAVQGEDFNEVAKENGYDVKVTTDIKELDETISGLGSQRQMVRWAFEEDSDIGSVKRFSLNNGFAVAVLAGKNKAGLMSAEKASATVLPILRKEKKAKLIRESASGTTLDALGASQNQAVKTALAINRKAPTISGAGREPAVIGAAFALNEGETSKLVDGENGVYMVEVTKKTPAAELTTYAAAAQRAIQAKLSASTASVYQALKEKANIEDNRAKVY